MFINLSNHQPCDWDEAMRVAVEQFDKPVISVPFPAVPKEATEPEIAHMAQGLVEKLRELVEFSGCSKPVYAMVQGEFTLTFAIVQALKLDKRYGIVPIAACGDRDPNSSPQKFAFFKFRRY